MKFFRICLMAALFVGGPQVEAQVPYNPDRVVVIVNTTKAVDAIFGVYITPASVQNWGANLLGCCVAVPAGNTVVVTVVGGAQCFVDIRVVFKSGRVKKNTTQTSAHT